jgi:predicted transcriptional regulator
MDLGVITVLASDMMSDVLAFAEPGALLVTGLTNSQSVRTADIADVTAIVYIRGKRPDDATVALARQLSIPVLVTEIGMVAACGILSSAGLQGVC